MQAIEFKKKWKMKLTTINSDRWCLNTHLSESCRCLHLAGYFSAMAHLRCLYTNVLPSEFEEKAAKCETRMNSVACELAEYEFRWEIH